ncbi:MAG: hypothetical protein QOI10_3487 [Solirubrobacterales bacterium]|jgi:hypothetical protein|nr:hypothetical protein [Solirubrobacterales bacterium]
MSAPARHSEAVEPQACPLCGRQLYGWVALPATGEAVIGAPVSELEHERVIDRCESCGVAIERGREVDLIAEWEAVCRPGEPGRRRISIPNRDSVQAWLGGVGWAAVDRYPGRLIHTPASLELLAAANGQAIERGHSPLSRQAQAWMWQTMLNGLTFHANFAREVRAGRLRAATARSRLRFGVDLVVTVLAAPLVLLVSAPLELGAALARRGGELSAVARPA